MQFSVHITARAESDLDDILAWIHSNAPATANRWYSRLMATVQTLETMPERGPLAAEAVDLKLELRELLFGKRRGVFRILYTIDETTVNVLHIHRATRGPIKQDDL